MHLRNARLELRANIEAGNAVLFTSPSGIGKSQMIEQEFQRLKAQDPKVRWGSNVIFAATQTPPDLIGFQFKGQREWTKEVPGPDGVVLTKKFTATVTDPSVPLWMLDRETGEPAWMFDKFFLLIDEYGQGEADVKRAVAEIFLNGGTSPWYLPPGSVRVACSNKGGRYGVTKDFDFCIARRTEISLTGDVDVWVEDFADKPYIYQGKVWQVMPVTKAWAKTNPIILFESEPAQQGPWCSPRTLTAADRYLQVKAAAAGGVVPCSDPIVTETVAGMIGMGATTSLLGHFQFALQLPSYEEVVADPAGTPVPTKADLTMLMAYQLAGRAQPADLAGVIQYVQRMPKDMGITFVSALLRRDYRNMINTPAMSAWISKNSGLLNLISALAVV